MISAFIIKVFKKKFIKGLKSTGGRSNLGRVTVRGIGGGNKINYRLLDNYRRINQYGVLVASFYDPNRTCKLGLVIFENSLTCLILMQKNINRSDSIYFGTLKKSMKEDKIKNPIKNGYSTPLLSMPLFSILSNIEFKPFTGGGICRSADTSCMLIGKTNFKGILKLNSK
jgi:large subunit ribosomal protein L2